MCLNSSGMPIDCGCKRLLFVPFSSERKVISCTKLWNLCLNMSVTLFWQHIVGGVEKTTLPEQQWT